MIESFAWLYFVGGALLLVSLPLLTYAAFGILGVLRQIRDQQIADSVNAEDARA